MTQQAGEGPHIHLARNLGLFDITMVGVGAMIGAGIFVLTGIAAGPAGPALILAFALNGVVTFLNAMRRAILCLTRTLGVSPRDWPLAAGRSECTLASSRPVPQSKVDPDERPVWTTLRLPCYARFASRATHALSRVLAQELTAPPELCAS